ncbi:MAG: L-threonylcarbamoyladenylate synthase [Candidatus Woesearchaeota archaeon]
MEKKEQIANKESMRIYRDFKKNKEEIIQEIEAGAVFIYPTDTIYGLGCNALDSEAVMRVRKIKQRYSKPFSVIAPSKEWIFNNLFVQDKYEKYIEKLPGKYTLIFKIKKKNCVVKEVARTTLGVRIPKHWISEIVQELGFPIVTTSVNITNKNPIQKLSEINKQMANLIDFAIDEGELKNKPSRVIDLTRKTPKIIR